MKYLNIFGIFLIVAGCGSVQPSMHLNNSSGIDLGHATPVAEPPVGDSVTCESELWNKDESNVLVGANLEQSVQRVSIEKSLETELFLGQLAWVELIYREAESYVGSKYEPKYFVREEFDNGKLIKAWQSFSCQSRTITGITGSKVIDCFDPPSFPDTSAWQPMVISGGRSWMVEPVQRLVVRDTALEFSYENVFKLSCYSSVTPPDPDPT